MKTNRYCAGILATALCVLFLQGCNKPAETAGERAFDMGYLLNNKDMQEFGEKLFFDKNLSTPEGQSCAACHGPSVGFTGDDEQVNKTGGVYPGAVAQRFGNRKPNSAAYATLSPSFHAFVEDGQIIFAGGNFWDGRATGHKLGNPAADQAQGPFLNPVEQNVADAKALVEKVGRSDYVTMFKKVGRDIWQKENIVKCNNIDLQYGIIGLAIAAYEHSDKVNQFSSKYDYYLKGKASLTADEKLGLKLFDGKGKCALCHVSKAEKGEPGPLFTDFTYDNVGVPRNLLNPWYTMDSTFNGAGKEWVDEGLADYLRQVPQYAMLAGENRGKHQVPTLRNVDKRPSETFVKAYGHNGYFKSLKEMVHFYNTRDLLPTEDKVSDPHPGVNCWPKPEVAENLNTAELGNLGLTDDEEQAIVAFLKTLSDGYEVKSEK